MAELQKKRDEMCAAQQKELAKILEKENLKHEFELGTASGALKALNKNFNIDALKQAEDNAIDDGYTMGTADLLDRCGIWHPVRIAAPDGESVEVTEIGTPILRLKPGCPGVDKALQEPSQGSSLTSTSAFSSDTADDISESLQSHGSAYARSISGKAGFGTLGIRGSMSASFAMQSFDVQAMQRSDEHHCSAEQNTVFKIVEHNKACCSIFNDGVETEFTQEYTEQVLHLMAGLENEYAKKMRSETQKEFEGEDRKEAFPVEKFLDETEKLQANTELWREAEDLLYMHGTHIPQKHTLGGRMVYRYEMGKRKQKSGGSRNDGSSGSTSSDGAAAVDVGSMFFSVDLAGGSSDKSDSADRTGAASAEESASEVTSIRPFIRGGSPRVLLISPELATHVFVRSLNKNSNWRNIGVEGDVVAVWDKYTVDRLWLAGDRLSTRSLKRVNLCCYTISLFSSVIVP